MTYPTPNFSLVRAFTPKESSLYQELSEYIPHDILLQAITDYAIGTAKDRSPIYWQIKPGWTIANARNNEKHIFDRDAFPPALFGGHLLNTYGDKSIIYLMPTEYDCIVARCYIPNHQDHSCIYLYAPTEQSTTIIQGLKVVNFTSNHSLPGQQSSHKWRSVEPKAIAKDLLNTQNDDFVAHIPDFSYLCNKSTNPNERHFSKSSHISRYSDFYAKVVHLYQNEKIVRLRALFGLSEANLGSY